MTPRIAPLPEPSSDESFVAAINALLDPGLETPERSVSRIVAAAAHLGSSSTEVWLSDIEQRFLVAFSPEADVGRQAIDGTMAGRAFISGGIVESEGKQGCTVWVPLLDGADRLGVLAVTVGMATDASRDRFRRLAAVASALLVARGRYTDAIWSARRRRHMSVAGELQWHTLPPNSFGTRDVSITGMVEPAYEMGGDAFDYAYDDDILHLAIFDAVGHDLDASILATLAVGTYRNSRRSGDHLIDVAASIDATVGARFATTRYVTGQIARFDVASGFVRIINAGHPAPLHIRNDRVVGPLACPTWVPFGLAHALDRGPAEVTEIQLEPGDGLLLYSDGVVEAGHAGGSEFGLDRLGQFLHSALAAELSPAETLRRLTHAVFDHHDGKLEDDATMLLLRWHPAV